jgi:hypothetical protein
VTDLLGLFLVGVSGLLGAGLVLHLVFGWLAGSTGTSRPMGSEDGHS